MQKNLTIENYMNELYSENPIPGGGSAAALVASTAISLCGMVFSLTINKKSFKDLNPEIQNKFLNFNDELNKLKEEVLMFMDKDGEAFMKLMKSYKLPKVSEEEIEVRKESIQNGYQQALNVPLELIKKSLDVYMYISFAAEYGNKNVISDAGAACLLIHSSIETSLLNMKINLVGIKDNKYKEEIKKMMLEYREKNDNEKNKIMTYINDYIKA